MTAKSWFKLHSFAGFAFGLLLLLVCFTGTLAVVSHEIQYLSDQKYRALSERQGPVPWQVLEQNLAKAYPDYQISNLNVPEQWYLAGSVSLNKGSEFLFAYFDPASGALTGEGQWGTVSRFLRNIHMYLSLGPTGKIVVTSLSFLLLIILVSSFYVYRQWWRKGFQLPSATKVSSRTFWSDWHKWTGVWCWGFILLMFLTGLWYFTEHFLLKFKVEHYPKAPKLELVKAQYQTLSLTELMQAAQKARPELDIRALNYPLSDKTPVVVTGQDATLLVRDRANRVYLDPVTAEVLKLQKAGELKPVAYIADMADPLHFGNFAGLGVKLLYFVFGLAFTFLVAGGVWMHWLRTKRQQPQLIRWLGWTGALSSVLVVTALVVTSVQFSQREVENLPLSPVLGSLQ
ncbi:PepSY-associated TM helix domain-containing protein [Rheinheimera soli]|uniref:PepSY-associated TM helix domain-containing protein n=1 Tax=Rheinheimera soli TaxID=443616 RepID=UPI001E2C6051|nr:PepSY-associated TM helix domain-containing protein [Rheinheimera soli]